MQQILRRGVSWFYWIGLGFYFLSGQTLDLLHARELSSNNINFRLGYGTYTMQNLKAIQHDIVQNLYMGGIRVKAVERFPPFYTYQFQYTRLINDRYRLGVVGDLASTAGRIDYRDYSGRIRVDMLLKRIGIGLLVEASLEELSHWLRISVTSQFNVLSTGLTIEESFTVTDTSSESIGSFQSLGIGLEPGIKLRYICSVFHLDVFFGVQLDVNTSFEWDSTTDLIQSAKMTSSRPTWLGVRLGIQAGVHW